MGGWAAGPAGGADNRRGRGVSGQPVVQHHRRHQEHSAGEAKRDECLSRAATQPWSPAVGHPVGPVAALPQPASKIGARFFIPDILLQPFSCNIYILNNHVAITQE